MSDVINPGKHIDKITRRIMELINNFEGVELGETHDKAYYGDRGKEAYEHSQLRSGNPHNVTARDLGLDTIQDQINAIMEVLGTVGDWQSRDGDWITDHEGERIQFHTVARILEYH